MWFNKNVDSVTRDLENAFNLLGEIHTKLIEEAEDKEILAGHYLDEAEALTEEAERTLTLCFKLGTALDKY